MAESTDLSRMQSATGEFEQVYSKMMVTLDCLKDKLNPVVLPMSISAEKTQGQPVSPMKSPLVEWMNQQTKRMKEFDESLCGLIKAIEL